MLVVAVVYNSRNPPIPPQATNEPHLHSDRRPGVWHSWVSSDEDGHVCTLRKSVGTEQGEPCHASERWYRSGASEVADVLTVVRTKCGRSHLKVAVSLLHTVARVSCKSGCFGLRMAVACTPRADRVGTATATPSKKVASTYASVADSGGARH